jgi:hypothetical protein
MLHRYILRRRKPVMVIYHVYVPTTVRVGGGGYSERTATATGEATMMKSRGADLFMLLALLCTVFVLFALVSKRDSQGKAQLTSKDPTRQVQTSNKRPKATLPGQTGIANYFAGGSVTHANTAQVEGPLSYSAPARTKMTGPEYLAKYVREYPWLKWGVNPLVASCVQDEGVPAPAKVLYCAHCVEKDWKVNKNGAPNPFYQGYPEFTYRPDALKTHAQVHISTIGLDDNQAGNQRGAMATISEEIKRTMQAGFMTLVSTMFYLAQQALSIHKFTSTVRDFLPNLNPPPALYLNSEGIPKYSCDKAAGEWLFAIDRVLTESFLAKLKKSPYYAWTIDETSDQTRKELMIIYVSYLTEVGEGVFADMHNEYFEICELKEATAGAIMLKLQERLALKGMVLTKFVANGSDGASVMQGNNKGVSTLWRKQVQPFAISQHCNSHKYALGVGDVHKLHAFCGEHDKLLTKTYGILSKSPKRQQAFDTFRLQTGETALSPKQLHAVRWSGRWHALKQVFANLVTWKLLFASLDTEGAQALLTEFQTYRFLITTAYLHDTLQILNTVTIMWQKEGLGFDEIEPALVAVRANISRMILDEGSTGGPMVRDMNATIFATGTHADMPVQYSWAHADTVVDIEPVVLDLNIEPDVQIPVVTDEAQAEPTSLDSDQVRINNHEEEWGFLSETFKQHSRDCLDALDKRFPNTTIVGAFAILAPRAYYIDVIGMQNAGTLAEFGYAKCRCQVPMLNDTCLVCPAKGPMEILLEHFGTQKTLEDGTVFAPMVDEIIVRSQFELFKTFMHTNQTSLVSEWHEPDGDGKCTPKKPMRFQDFMKAFPDQLAKFDQLFILMQIALLTPMTSVPCERGFSRVTLIKTKWRNRMFTKVLDALMRISLVDMTLKFFIAAPNMALQAIDYFVDLRNRYVSIATRTDPAMRKVLVEREESVAALKVFCTNLEEIHIDEDTDSDDRNEQDHNERQHFIVDDDDE